jgi:hypothetical protein
MNKRKWNLLAGGVGILAFSGAQGVLWGVFVPQPWSLLCSFVVGLIVGLAYGVYATMTWYD